jgi:uncharacterized protein (TIGR03437 family)
VVAVDGAGNVSSRGFGRADITVRVGGLPRAATAKVYAGHLRIEPAILYLSIGGVATGKFTVDAANADGTPADLRNYPIKWNLNAPPDVATSAGDGTVTALRRPLTGAERPTMFASAGNLDIPNWGVIRINDPPFDPDVGIWRSGSIALYAPKQAATWDYASIIQQFDIPRVIGLAYDLERAATGVAPSYGDVQDLVVEAAWGPDPTIPCGGNGNPVLLGTDLSQAINNNCFIAAAPPIEPWWSVYFHEMGHNFTLTSQKFQQFSFSGTDASNFPFSEGLATLLGMYTSFTFAANPGAYGISTASIQAMLTQTSFGYGTRLSDYLATGPSYTSLDPSILDDMLAVLMNENGGRWVYRFYSVFLPQMTSGYPFVISSVQQQATFFVAAVSAAIGTDLRQRFRAWGFPIDDTYYGNIYPGVSALVAQRDPAAFAGQNRVMTAGDSLVLADAEAFAANGQPQIQWVIASAPTGAQPLLSGPTSLHPTFKPDVPGTYTLSLTARDPLFASAPSTVTVTVKPGPPAISTGGAVNGASFQPGISSGAWIAIFGTNLASTARGWRNDEIVNGKLPTQLDGVSATIDGKPAAVCYISPAQVNVQVPDDSTVGSVAVQVTTPQGTATATAQMQQFSPGLFTFDGTYLAAQHVGYSYVGKPNLLSGTPTTPAKPGEVIILWGTGLGPSNPATPAGRLVTQAAPLANPVTVFIGGAQADMQWAGISGAGLWQINVKIPDSLPDGDAVVVAEVDGVQTQGGAYLTVQR